MTIIFSLISFVAMFVNFIRFIYNICSKKHKVKPKLFIEE